MSPADVSREAKRYSVGKGGVLVSGKEKRFCEGLLGASWGNAISKVSKQETGIHEFLRRQLCQH